MAFRVGRRDANLSDKAARRHTSNSGNIGRDGVTRYTQPLSPLPHTPFRLPAVSDSLDFPDSQARVITLPNGLEIIVQEDHSSPVVSLQAWCRAGSMHEGPWLGAGMSHFLEHMLFKGTARRGAGDIARTVQEAGGYINAYTSFDRTVYWIDCPSSGWETCLDVLCDTVGGATLPEEEFEKEREVIRREFAMGEDNPDQVLSRRLFSTAFSRHPSRHPVIGYLDLFNQLSRADLAAYYEHQYTPDNLFIVVAGDVNPEAVAEAIDRHLGHLKRRRRDQSPLPQEPRQLGRRERREEFPTDLSRSIMAWRVPGLAHPDTPAVDVLAVIAGGGRSSRLYRTIREREGLAHSVYAWSWTPPDSGLFAAGTETEPGKREAAESAIARVLSEIARDGIQPNELEKCVRQALSSQLSTLSTMRGQASDLGSNWNLTRNLDFTRDYVRAVQRLRPADITEAARRYLVDDQLTLVSLDPTGTRAAAAARGTVRRSDDIQRVVLDNGLTVLLHEDKRLPLATVNAIFRGGLLGETEENNGITRLAARLLVKDTQNRSAEAVAEAIESVGGSIGSSFGNNSFSVSADHLRPDLDLAIDLVADALCRPAFLPETLAQEKRYQLAAIKSELDQPMRQAIRRLRRSLYGAHPYGLAGAGTEESLASLERATAEGFRQRFVAGNNGVLAVFGDIDGPRALDRLAQAFAAVPPGEKAFTRPAAPLPDLRGEVIEEHHPKSQAILLVGFRTCPLDHPDHDALELIDEACSDMASRLFMRLREELSLAYSVGATRLAGLEPGAFIFYIATSPEKIDLAQAELLGQIEALASHGLELQELDRAKNSLLGREKIHLQGTHELAVTAAVDELLGLGWDNHRHSERQIRAVDVDQTREVAARYFDPAKGSVVRFIGRTES